MNKQTISIQTSITSDTHTVLNDAGKNNELKPAEQTFTARNIVIRNNNLQMEVELDGRWQLLRLAINNGKSSPLHIEAANVTVLDKGRTLTLTTPEQHVQVKAANELLSLLNLAKNQTLSSNVLHDVSITEKPHPQLHFCKLGVSLSINPALAQMLKNENKLIAGIHASAHKIAFTLFNQFEDKLLTGTVSKNKVIEALLGQKLTPLILVGKQDVQVKFAGSQQPLKLDNVIINAQPSKTTNTWQPMEISKQIQGIKFSQIPQSQLLELAKPIKRQIFGVTKQTSGVIKNVDTARTETTLSYSKPLLNIDLDDIKQAVKTAIHKWVSLPFTHSYTPKDMSKAASSPTTFSPQLLNHIGPNMVLKTAQLNDASPVVQLISQLTKMVQQSIQVKSVAHKEAHPSSINTQVYPLPTNAKTNSPDSLSKQFKNTSYSPKLPIERLLLSTLLPIKTSEESRKVENPDISKNINALLNYKNNHSVDLTRLVNNAFSRMISEENTTPTKIFQEIQSQLGQVISPTSTSSIQSQASFSQAIEKLLITLLAAPKTVQGYTEEEQITRLNTLLKTILPEFKSIQTKQLLQNLPSLQSKLMDDLIQVNNATQTILPTNTNAAKFDSEAQLLLSLFLPMKLPAETKLTELKIGHYKKKTKENMPEKTVWFIRLNFDYASQGKISAHAELMDKALDVKISANTAQAHRLAAPHLDGLRRKLCEHGLQVGEIDLLENADPEALFFDNHSIVNIQV
jgi:hypothetical protein